MIQVVWNDQRSVWTIQSKLFETISTWCGLSFSFNKIIVDYFKPERNKIFRNNVWLSLAEHYAKDRKL